MLPNRQELREQQRRQGERQVVPKHPQEEQLQRVQQVQEQRPIDYFGRVQVPMPIGRFRQLEQQVPQLEGECYCN